MDAIPNSSIDDALADWVISTLAYAFITWDQAVNDGKLPNEDRCVELSILAHNAAVNVQMAVNGNRATRRSEDGVALVECDISQKNFVIIATLERALQIANGDPS